SSLWTGRYGGLRKFVNDPGEHDDRIGHAKVAPGMSTRPANNHFETAASQRFGNNSVGACTVENQTCLNRVLPSRGRKNVAHASKVTFAFLADIADKKQSQGVANTDVLQSRRNRKHGGNAGSIVGDAGAVQPASLLADVQRRACGEDCVQMSTQTDVARAMTGMRSKDVADLVLMNLLEPRFVELTHEPLAAG